MKISHKTTLPLLITIMLVLSLTHTQTATATASISRGNDLEVSAAPLLSNIKGIDLGGDHSCAITNDGAVKCWGLNSSGELGVGVKSTSSLSYLSPVAVKGLTTGVVALAAGRNHTCALTSNGEVNCWGDNSRGQLGDGTTSTRLVPTNVTGLSDIIAISVGNWHTCALNSNGAVKCWGDNSRGQLGDGTTTNRNTPTDVVGLSSEIVSISNGDIHTCAVTSQGEALCWGANGAGQLGDGTTIQRLTPTGVFGLASGVVSISSAYRHTCAIISGGEVMCWGDNQNGAIGDGTNTNRLTPTNVISLAESVTALTTGLGHTCALTASGKAMCWGHNGYGQLGDGTTTSRLQPVEVSGFSSGVAIATGHFHSCALVSNGRVKCWGGNARGQLGDGTTADRWTSNYVLALRHAILYSNGTQDGYIWESTETSGVGLKADSIGSSLLVGDDNYDRQYRAILSFDTSTLSDTITIYSAVIALIPSSTQGVYFYWSPLLVDIRKSYFGSSIFLLPHDFQVVPSLSATSTVDLASNYAWLNNAGLPYINLAGNTQFRLRFQQDDNDNMRADYIGFYSGNTAAALRPQLVIYYYGR